MADGETTKEPEVASLPIHEPDDTHEVAPVVDQVKVVVLPTVMELGFATRVTVGTGRAGGGFDTKLLLEVELELMASKPFEQF